jgi:hypothetical protein
MRRHNYAPPPLALAIAAVADYLAMPGLRAPAAIVAATLAAIAVTVAVEFERIGALDRAAVILQARVTASAASAARASAIDAQRERMQRIETAIAQAHRETLASLNDLALLGNRLPAQTWLTGIRADRDGTWSVEGRSGRVPEVGTTLAGVQRIEPAGRVRLLSLAGPAERARAIHFSLAWERPQR